MHGFTASQAAPHRLRLHRGQWREHAHERLEHGVQRVERVLVLIPEPVARVADIPVGEHVDEVGDLVARVGDLKRVHMRAHLCDELARAGEQIAVHLRQARHLIRGQFARVVALSVVRGVRIQREEVVRAPHGQHDLAHRVTDALGRDDEIAAAQDRRAHQEPAHRVGTILVEHAVDVGVIAQVLAHLLAVVTEHNAVTDHVLERRLVEQRGRHDVQQVEPATGLANVFDDEVGREVLLEILLVLERVMVLGERHRTGLEPAVQHVGDAVHRRLAGRVVGVRTRQLVDIRAVHVDVALVVTRVVTEIGLELVKRTVDVDARVFRVVAHPHRDRRTPEAVA